MHNHAIAAISLFRRHAFARPQRHCFERALSGADFVNCFGPDEVNLRGQVEAFATANVRSTPQPPNHHGGRAALLRPPPLLKGGAVGCAARGARARQLGRHSRRPPSVGLQLAALPACRLRAVESSVLATAGRISRADHRCFFMKSTPPPRIHYWHPTIVSVAW